MPDLYEDASEHYDRVTEAWRFLLGDELHYGVFGTGDESLATATDALTGLMAEAAQLRPGLSVLDVGCGTGAPACELAARFGVSVVGITTSEVGVAAARERAAAAGLSGVSFEKRDGTDNGFPSASFDRVWVLESSHLMRERERLISECARVLRPSGRLVLCDIIRHRSIPFREVRARRDDFATLRAAFGDAHMEPLALYAEYAERHGLRIESERDLSRETLPTFARWRENAARRRGDVVTRLGAEGLDAFERSTEILEGMWLDGTLGYGMLSAVKLP